MKTPITPYDMSPLAIFIVMEQYYAPLVGKHGKTINLNAEVRIIFEERHNYWRLRFRDDIWWGQPDDFYVSSTNQDTNQYLNYFRSNQYQSVKSLIESMASAFPQLFRWFRLHELLAGSNSRRIARGELKRDQVEALPHYSYPSSFSLQPTSSTIYTSLISAKKNKRTICEDGVEVELVPFVG